MVDPDRAWEAAEHRYSGVLAEAMFPLLAEPPSRDEVIDRLEEIVRDRPDYYPALLHLGVLQAGAGRTEEARRHLLAGADALAARQPVSPDDLEVTGAVTEPLEEALRYDLVRNVLRRLTGHYPSEPGFHDELGAALVVLGESEEAVRCFETAIELEPENARYRCNLGWAFLAAGRLDDAERHLVRSLEMNPDDAVARGNHEILLFLRPEGGTFGDYLLRPLDRAKLIRLAQAAEDSGDDRELELAVKEWNRDRLEAWRLHLCRRREPPDFPEVFRSLRAFFELVQELVQEPFPLYEDLDDLLKGRFELLVELLVSRTPDLDPELLEEIYSGLLSFYGFLEGRGLVGEDDFQAFRAEALAAKPSLLRRVER